MLILSEAHYAEVSAHAAETYPNECCGILLGRRDGEARLVSQVVNCRNSHSEPARHFSIGARELIDAQRNGRESEQEIVGFYHSHPDEPPNWSRTDLEEAHWDGCSYVIVSVESGVASTARSFVLRVTHDGKWLMEEALCVATPEELCMESRAS